MEIAIEKKHVKDKRAKRLWMFCIELIGNSFFYHFLLLHLPKMNEIMQ